MIYKNYKTIFKIISGFLDKYQNNKQCRKLCKHSTITFSMFVDELVKNNWNVDDKHHFTPQTTKNFNNEIINPKCIKHYDIKNIDYDFIEKL